MRRHWFVLVAVLALVLAACGGGGAATTTESAGEEVSSSTTNTTAGGEAGEDHEEGEEGEHGHEGSISIDAPVATITVDGDPSDWADIPGADIVLSPIEEEEGKGPEERQATVKFAHDADRIYALVTVEDDYNFDPEDTRLSAAVGVMFNISGAPHMGAEDDAAEQSVGMVDIWHWELGCAAGERSGGAVNPPGDGDPGNDATCNLDDEWALSAEDREDDNKATAENSLLGVWSHSNPVEDGEGEWYFELSRPLQTGDEQDAQFEVGGTAQAAVAYWDPDFGGVDGWDGDQHVQSADLGWILVNLLAG